MYEPTGYGWLRMWRILGSRITDGVIRKLIVVVIRLDQLTIEIERIIVQIHFNLKPTL